MCHLVCIFCEHTDFFPLALPTPESHCKSLQSLHPRRHIAEFAGPHKHTFWSLVLINCVMLLSNSLCLMTVDAGFWASEWKTCLGGSVLRGPGWSPGLQTPVPPVALQGLPFKNAVRPSLCGPNCASPSLQGMEELAFQWEEPLQHLLSGGMQTS